MAKIRDHIFYTGALLAMALSCNNPPSKSRESPPPNILFIAVDDLRPELKAYGNQLMVTPNIDQLASEGVMFLNHFVNVPTCGASRYSMLTGTYPQNTGALSNNIFEKQTAGKAVSEKPESFAELFRKSGYHTIGIGKISHSPDGMMYGYNQPVSDKMELPNSWDEFLFNSGKWGTGWNAFFGYANGENRQSLNGQVKPYESAIIDDNGYADGLTAELAVKHLYKLRKGNKPFLLAVGFFKPHLPFNAPKKYWDLYDEAKIPLPALNDIPKNVNPLSLHNSNEFNQYEKGDEKASLKNPVSDAYARKLRHAYFASVSYVDTQIGKVLQALKETGLYKNTIVVLWGDHGWHLGDQRIWGKHTLSEYALKSPLIIKSPGIKNGGAKVKSIVQSVDIYPTLLELANLKALTDLDGQSLLQQLKKADAPTSNAAFGYFNRGITLRAGKYRVTKYYRKEQPVVELYDYEQDPFETKNIADENTTLTDSLLTLLEKGNTGLYK